MMGEGGRAAPRGAASSSASSVREEEELPMMPLAQVEVP